MIVVIVTYRFAVILVICQNKSHINALSEPWMLFRANSQDNVSGPQTKRVNVTAQIVLKKKIEPYM